MTPAEHAATVREDIASLRATIDGLRPLPVLHQDRSAALDRIEAHVVALAERATELEHELRLMTDIAERRWVKMEKEAERAERAETALRGLFDAIGNPEDVDQDCRFCMGHYGEHSDTCPWAIARAALGETAPTVRGTLTVDVDGNVLISDEMKQSTEPPKYRL